MTPRRIVLTIIALLAFGFAYAVYNRLFGWIDGLPLLPARMLSQSDSTIQPPVRATSPTIERLELAFGKNSPETEPAFYPMQLEFRNGETSTVVAAGQPPSNPRSHQVDLSPFSVAVFGKVRPEHLRQPGEIVEISTFHSDKASLYFDRIIMTAADMSIAKLVKIELISAPEMMSLYNDKRIGRVHITNNQRSSDPNRRLVLKSVGPVFYQDTTVFLLTDPIFEKLRKLAPATPESVLRSVAPLKDKELARADFMRELKERLSEKEFDRWKNTLLAYASGNGIRRDADMWTDAFVELVDHSNVPRRAGTDAVTAPMLSEELRNNAAVADILRGQRVPPPTVTALGMKVYLAEDSSKNPAKKAGGGGTGGLRLIKLLEQVTMNLWMEGGQGLVGSEGKSAVIPEAPPASAALAGGLVPGLYATRELNRDLLQIETRGPFAFDAEKNVARFDVLTQADPNLTNDVRATKVPPKPGIQTLFSQVLEIEFNGSPVGTTDSPQPATPAKPSPNVAAKGKDGKDSGSGPKFKRIHAWTYTPGRFLTISSDVDQMEAYGQDLVRTQATDAAPESTRLVGSPLYVVQQRSVLTAGAQNTPGTLIREPAANGIDTRTTVLGVGHLELYDAAAKANTIAASWQTSMVQTKERVGDRDLELYVFTDAAKLEDLQSAFWIKGNVLKLWMAPNGKAKDAEARSTSPANPTSRLQLDKLLALGDVTARSNDLDIEYTDTLTAWFRDIPPPDPAGPKAGGVSTPAQPKEPGSPAQPREPGSATAGPQNPSVPLPQPVAPDAEAEPKEPEKPKPPMKVRARTIESRIVRYPQPKTTAPTAPGKSAPPSTPAPAPGESTSGGMKYQLESARCEGMVVAHQDPDDPSKPRGTDIIGSLMLIDSAPDGSGSRLTVFGWDFRPGEVHNEGTSLIGPKVMVDQLHNIAVIEGRGTLVMPANNDLMGQDKKTDPKTDPKPDQKPEEKDPIIIHFRDRMNFEGSPKGVAEFFGKVNASQGESWIVCDHMTVNMDKPVYFSQTNRPASKSANSSSSKGSGPQASKGASGPSGGASADDDKAKVDVIYCYPAPADIAENDQEKIVVFTQIEREAGTGKPNAKKVLIARELTIRAQMKDESRGEPYRLVFADGPGITRTWAPESKDDDPAKDPMKPPAAQDGPAEVEMKLTVIFFSGRMTAKDKGETFKEATFTDSVHVINLPTDNPDFPIERHRLPPTAVQITAREKLVVWTHKNPRLPDGPAVQYMYAKGNAFMQNDEYDGWGEEIRSEGKVVWFDGTSLAPARIKSRFKAADNAGRQIRLDRALNRYTVIGGSGGQFIEGNGGGNDDGLKVLPPPMPPANKNPNQSPNQKPGANPNSNPNQPSPNTNPTYPPN